MRGFRIPLLEGTEAHGLLSVGALLLEHGVFLGSEANPGLRPAQIQVSYLPASFPGFRLGPNLPQVSCPLLGRGQERCWS